MNNCFHRLSITATLPFVEFVTKIKDDLLNHNDSFMDKIQPKLTTKTPMTSTEWQEFKQSTLTEALYIAYRLADGDFRNYNSIIVRKVYEILEKDYPFCLMNSIIGKDYNFE